MARNTVGVNILDATLGSYDFAGIAKLIGDPFTPGAAAANDAAVAAADAATAKTATALVKTAAATAAADAVTAKTATATAKADAVTAHTAAQAVSTYLSGIAATAAGLQTATTNTVDAFIAAFSSDPNSLLNTLFTAQPGGSVTFSNTTLEYSGTPAAGAPTVTTTSQEATIALLNTFGAAFETMAGWIAYYDIVPWHIYTALETMTTALNQAATVATYGIEHVFSNQSFNETTMQYTGTPSGSVTPAETVQLNMLGYIDTAGMALLALQATATTWAAFWTTAITDMNAAIAATATVVADTTNADNTVATVEVDIAAVATDATDADGAVATVVADARTVEIDLAFLSGSNAPSIVDDIATAKTATALAKADAVTAYDAATGLLADYGTAFSTWAMADADFDTAYGDFVAAMSTDTNSLLYNFFGVPAVSFSNSTLNFSGTPGGASGITSASQADLCALMSTFGTAMLAAQTAIVATASTYGGTDGATALMTTAIADLNLIATTATYGLVALLASTTYNATTMQYTYGGSTTITLDQAQQEGLIALCNTAGTALRAAWVLVAGIAADWANTEAEIDTIIAATAQAVTDATTADNDVAQVQTDVETAPPGNNNLPDVIISVNAETCPTMSLLEIAAIGLPARFVGLNVSTGLAP